MSQKQWDKEMTIESINSMLMEHEYLMAAYQGGTSSPKDVNKDDIISSRGKILQAIRKLIEDRDTPEEEVKWRDML